MSIRLLSYNIRFGGAEREAQIGDVIRACDPQIVILQEATRPDVVERLAKLCDMPTWGAMAGDSLAFLSRIGVQHHAWHHVLLAKRRYLEVVLAGSGVRIFGVHLAAVHSNVTERRRSYELKALLRGIAQHGTGFHIVTGDFNTLAPGEKFDLFRLPRRLQALIWLTGRRIRFTAIQHMLDAGYADAYRTLHNEHGYTFPTWDPHVRLDYAFVPAAYAERVTRCEVVLDAPHVREASDHFPLLFEFK